MNMNLNAQQIVLLCLLVAFVTSITTAISVVSLSSQEQEPVTQTINRVVERTIERVVEPESEAKENNVVTTPERIIETVVVNQEDLTVDAVQKNSKSLVRVHAKNRNEIGDFVTLGVVVSGDSIVVDRNMINDGQEYFIKTENNQYLASISNYEQGRQFAILKIEGEEVNLSPAEFSDSNSLQLAQTVISLSGSSDSTVSVGIINKLDSIEKVDGDNSRREITQIHTGVDQNNILIGSILLNLQGKIIGIKTYNPDLAKTTFIPTNSLRNFVSENTN